MARSSDIAIRRALPEDAEAISALILGVASAFLLEPGSEDAERFLQGMRPAAIETHIGDADLHYLTAFVQGRLAGVVAVRATRHLFHLFVAPEWQGQGIARQLWQTARAAAVAAGNRQGFTVNSTPAAVPVYERFGFRTTGPRIERNGIAFVPMQAPSISLGA